MERKGSEVDGASVQSVTTILELASRLSNWLFELMFWVLDILRGMEE